MLAALTVSLMRYGRELTTDQATFLTIFKVGLLVYFLLGAVQGEVEIPRLLLRSAEPDTIKGIGAWLVCLCPVVWLASDLVRYGGIGKIGIEQRKSVARTLAVLAFAIFFIALVI